MTKRNVHVVPRDKGWAVETAGKERADSLHKLKSEAMERGRELAQKNKVELIPHNKDGKISNPNSYGNDPFPPRDTRR